MTAALTPRQRDLLDRVGDEPHFFNGAATEVLNGLLVLGLVERTKRAHDGGYWRRTAAGEAYAPRDVRGPDFVSAMWGPSNASVSRYERELLAKDAAAFADPWWRGGK